MACLYLSTKKQECGHQSSVDCPLASGVVLCCVIGSVTTQRKASWINLPPKCSLRKASMRAQYALGFRCLLTVDRMPRSACFAKWRGLPLSCPSTHCVGRKWFCSTEKTWNGDFVANLRADHGCCSLPCEHVPCIEWPPCVQMATKAGFS